MIIDPTIKHVEPKRGALTAGYSKPNANDRWKKVNDYGRLA